MQWDQLYVKGGRGCSSRDIATR